MNAVLVAEQHGDACVFRPHDCGTRCLAFAVGQFLADTVPCEVYLLMLAP